MLGAHFLVTRCVMSRSGRVRLRAEGELLKAYNKTMLAPKRSARSYMPCAGLWDVARETPPPLLATMLLPEPTVSDPSTTRAATRRALSVHCVLPFSARAVP